MLLGIFTEYVVFGFIYKPSGLPILKEGSGVLKYIPKQEGMYRIKDEIAAPYSINNMGWNSAVDYFQQKQSNKIRICVIGDSTIEALQVPVTQNIAGIFRFWKIFLIQLMHKIYQKSIFLKSM